MDSKRTAGRAAAAIALAVLCACGGSSSVGPTASVTLVPAASSIRNDGTPVTITATARAANGTPGTGSIAFTAQYGTLTSTTGGAATALTLAADGTAQANFACNVVLDPRCAPGTALVSAVWNSIAGSTQIVLTAASGGGSPPPPPPGGGGSPPPPPPGGPPGPASSIVATSAVPSVLGLKGSGIQERGTATFTVTDAQGIPVPGITVNFAQMAPQLVTLMSATAVTDMNGLARASYTAGAEVGVSAITATVATPAIGTVSRTIAVRGAKPSANGFYFRCEHASLPVYTTIAELETMNCTVRLTDRYGNRVGIPTAVSFATEAGAIPASVTTKGFDPANPNDPTEGTATVVFTTDTGNGNRPADVAPLPATAPGAQYPWDRLAEPSKTFGALTLNPRDQLVTLIAMTRGEEAFEDANHNGVFDPGEVFVDQGDPYVDANDNGAYDANLPGGLAEVRFCGLNADCSTYHGPNGVWDANTVIWEPTWVVFAGPGAATTAPAGQAPPATMFSLPCADYADAFVAGHASLIAANIYAYDRWMNTPSAGFTVSVGTPSSNKLIATGLGLTGPALETWGAMGILGWDFGWMRVAASNPALACNVANGAACIEKLLFRTFGDGFNGVVTVKNSTTKPAAPASTTGTGCAPGPDQFGSPSFLLPITVNNAHGVAVISNYSGLFAVGTGQ